MVNDALIADRPAVAALELASIARGVVCLDAMAKRAENAIVAARTISPGRYLILLSGTVAEIEDWRDRFLLGAENALRTRPKDEEALKDEQIKKLKQKIGDLVLETDVLREALKPYPLDRKTSDA